MVFGLAAFADDINLIDIKANAASPNTIVFNYSNPDELGDSISGLDGLPTSSVRFQFSFNEFEGDANSNGVLDNTAFFVAGASMTQATSASQFYIYDTVNHDLYYDADGSGAASAPELVAHITSTSAYTLTASHIVFTA